MGKGGQKGGGQKGGGRGEGVQGRGNIQREFFQENVVKKYFTFHITYMAAKYLAKYFLPIFKGRVKMGKGEWAGRI